MSVLDTITSIVDQYKDLAVGGTEKAGVALGKKIAEELETYVKSTENTLDDTFAIEFLEGVCSGIKDTLATPATETTEVK